MAGLPGRQIGVREVRRQLSSLIAAARAGERITITMRGEPVASLGPVGGVGERVTIEALRASGLIDPPKRRDRPDPPHPHLLPADVRLDRVMDQIRGSV